MWPLLEVVDEALGEPWMRPLASHLQAEPRAPVRRRAPPGRPVRPLRAAAPGAHPGLGRRRGRALAAGAVAAPERAAGRARPGLARGGRVRAAARRAGPSRTSRRASRCSASRGCPAGQLRVLDALALHRDVRLFLLHPSPALWQPARRHRRASRAAPRTRRSTRPRTACWPRGGRTRVSSSSCSARTSVPRSIRWSTRPARCWPASRPACARTPPRGRAAPRPRRRPAAAGPRRPQRRGPRLPRPRAPGRGPARRDPARDGGGPGARAARRDRDVPGHRGLRAAHPGHVRGGGHRRSRATRSWPACRTCGCGSPTARCARRTRCSASSRGCWSSPRQRLTASQVIDFADREPVRRRFRLDDDDARALRGVDRRQRHPLGPGRRPPRAVQAREAGRGHVAQRAWTGCCWA